VSFTTATGEIMKTKVKRKKDKRKHNNPCNLTNRELEICMLVYDGLTSTKIAEKLGIARRTVETHKNNLYLKTGIKKSVGLARFTNEFLVGKINGNNER
jgi:DNA-binding NarL/FixJ family response regulator